MLRPIFGGTTGKDGRSAAGEQRPKSVTGQPHRGPRHGSRGAATRDDEGGFFRLAPKEQASGDSLFDDLDVKPPAASAGADVDTAAIGATSEASQDPGAVGTPDAVEGAFSAFQFMADVSVPPVAPFREQSSEAPEDEGAPLAGPATALDGGDEATAGAGTSAFSFLAATSAAPDESRPPANPDGGVDATDPGITTSSFPFLSDIENTAPPAKEHVTPTDTAATAEDDGVKANSGGEGGVGAGSVSIPPAVAPSRTSSSSSSTRGARPGVPALDGAEQATGQAGLAPPGASWKPSAGIVRKKRVTSRRVGYARDETVSAPLATVERASSPAAAAVSSAGIGTGGLGKGEGDRDTMPIAASVSPSGGGISYVPQDIGLQHRASPGARKKSGDLCMEDSVVAEAAAMAALAASMAPGNQHGAPTATKGDLKQASSHGTASSSSSNQGIASAATAAAAGASQTATPASAIPMPPLEFKRSPSLISKFKGLLSSKPSDESPSSSTKRPRSFPDHSPSKTDSNTAAASPPGDGDQGGSYVQPAFSPGQTKETRGENEETGGREDEGVALQELTAELGSLVSGFQQRSKSLSGGLSEAAAQNAALGANRAAIARAHAEGVRRLAEAEAEQQRLADAEEFEKAAELSADIESLKEECGNTAGRLRELEEEEAFLKTRSSECRAELLKAVDAAANSLRVFQGRQDGKLGRLVAERAVMFEAESRRMNTEGERIALEKTHVERDAVHLEEEVAQTEEAISLQTGDEDDRIAKLALMRMELEGEVKDLEAQLEAKKGALREVMSGLQEAEARVDGVRGKFDRQLQRLRERERLVAMSRQDCRAEQEALDKDRARHQERMEEATREQQVLQEAVAGIAEEVKLAATLQTTLATHWEAEPRISGNPEGGVGGGDSTGDNAGARLETLRAEVETARSRHEAGLRELTTLEEERELLRAESITNDRSLPGLEHAKRAAVAAKNYKEAGQVSRQIKDTEKRQQEVSQLLGDLDEKVAAGSDARKKLEATKAELVQAEEALHGAEEELAASKIAALERCAKPLRRACQAIVRARNTKSTGLRNTAEALLLLQLSSLEAEAKDIGSRHGFAPPDFSLPRPGDSDDDNEETADAGGDSSVTGDNAAASSGASPRDSAAASGVRDDKSDGAAEPAVSQADAESEDDASSPAGVATPSAEEENAASSAAKELLAAETAEVERDLAALDVQLADALAREDYDEAADLDDQMTQMRARLVDFAAESASIAGGHVASERVAKDSGKDVQTTALRCDPLTEAPSNQANDSDRDLSTGSGVEESQEGEHGGRDVEKASQNASVSPQAIADLAETDMAQDTGPRLADDGDVNGPESECVDREEASASGGADGDEERAAGVVETGADDARAMSSYEDSSGSADASCEPGVLERRVNSSGSGTPPDVHVRDGPEVAEDDSLASGVDDNARA